MKFATTMLLAMLVLVPFAVAQGNGPGAAGQVVIGFTGKAIPTNSLANPYTCFWYFPFIEGLDAASLFKDPGSPSEQTAYFTWVSDFGVKPLPQNGPFVLLMIPAGTATVYYTANPSGRKWDDPNTFKGDPVATFTRKASLYVLSGAADTFTFSADLVWSKTFTVNGKPFNFREVFPHGITCLEMGNSGAEAGTCVATGGGF